MKAIFVLFFLAILALAFAEVKELTADNFDSVITSNKLTFVKFYAPWCGHCKRMAPALDEAGQKLGDYLRANLKGDIPNVTIAKVDCTADVNKPLCQRYGVRGYPTINLFTTDKKSIEFKGARTVDAILSAIVFELKDKFSVLSSADDVRDFIKFNPSSSVINKVIVYSTGDASSKLPSVLKLLSANINHASTEVAFYANHTEDKVEIYRYGETSTPTSLPIDTTIDVSKLKSYIKQHGVPVFGVATSDTYRDFTANKLPIVAVVFNKKVTEQSLEALRPIAEEFKGKVTVVKIDGGQWAKFGTPYSITSTGIAIDDQKQNKKYVPTQQPTLTDINAVRTFVQSFLNGELQPYVRSQPIPSDNSGPLTTVVGHNFNDIVLDKDRDVFMFFHAPWCGHCKKAKPTYEQLAEHFKDDSNIVIAQLDATANDFDGPRVTGYPSLFMFPKDNKSKPVRYQGNRSLEDFIQFIEKNRRTTPAAPAATDDNKPKKDEL